MRDRARKLYNTFRTKRGWIRRQTECIDEIISVLEDVRRREQQVCRGVITWSLKRSAKVGVARWLRMVFTPKREAQRIRQELALRQLTKLSGE
jgi:hypothetical protein